ncbi:MAG TPA: hypothetical protein VH481_08970 [Nitrososphaeraceae archaeon]|jgi:hypothetical protein
MTQYSVILFASITLAILLLLYQQGVGAVQELSIQVWLADVKPDTGKVQVCVDIPESGASNCKKFDASASKKDSLGLPSDPIIIDSGMYKLGLNNTMENSTLSGCVYVFKDETGYCSKDRISPINETHEMMLFTKVKPVFYDKETGRLYEYGQCYLQKEGTKFCVEDEGVQYPEMSK